MATQIKSVKANSQVTKICELCGKNCCAFSLTRLCMSSAGSSSGKALGVCGSSVKYVVTKFPC